VQPRKPGSGKGRPRPRPPSVDIKKSLPQPQAIASPEMVTRQPISGRRASLVNESLASESTFVKGNAVPDNMLASVAVPPSRHGVHQLKRPSSHAEPLERCPDSTHPPQRDRIGANTTRRHPSKVQDPPAGRVRYTATPTKNQDQDHSERHRERPVVLQNLRADVAEDKVSLAEVPAHTMQRMHEEDGNPGHSDKQTNSVDRCAAKNFERLRKLDQFEQIVEHGDNIDHLVNHLLHNRDKTPEQERRPPAVMVSPSLLEGAPPSPSWALGSPSWKSRHNNNDVTNKDGRNTNLDIDSSVRFVSQTD